MFTMSILLFFTSIGRAEPSRTACDGLANPQKLVCIKQNYPAIHAAVEKTCANESGAVGQCRAREYGARGIEWVARGAGNNPGNASAQRPNARMKPLNPTTVTIATIGLTTAGIVMQGVPARCAEKGDCKMSVEEQQAVAGYGGVIAAQASRIPAILSTREPDNVKIDQLLGVLDDAIAQAPLGLSAESQVYVDGAITAARSVIAGLAER